VLNYSQMLGPGYWTVDWGTITSVGVLHWLQDGTVSHHAVRVDFVSAVAIVLLAMSAVNMPAVQVLISTMAQFRSGPIQTLEPHPLGGPKKYPYLSTSSIFRVCLDPYVPISGSGVPVFLFMVALRNPTVKHKLLTLVCHYQM